MLTLGTLRTPSLRNNTPARYLTPSLFGLSTPSTFQQFQALRQVELSHSHLKRKVVKLDYHLPDRKTGNEYRLQALQLLACIPHDVVIIDDGIAYTKPEFDRHFLDTLGRFIYSQANLSLFSNTEQKRKILFLIHYVFNDLCRRSQELTSNPDSLRDFLQFMRRLIPSFFHCDDYVEQEMSLIYAELYKVHSAVPLASDDLIFLKIQELREKLLKQCIGEIGQSEKLDECTTAKYYHYILQDQLNLSSSENSSHANCHANRKLEHKVVELFWSKYKVDTMIQFLNQELENGGLPFTRVYDWFKSHKIVNEMNAERYFDLNSARIPPETWRVLLLSIGVLKKKSTSQTHFRNLATGAPPTIRLFRL